MFPNRRKTGLFLHKDDHFNVSHGLNKKQVPTPGIILQHVKYHSPSNSTAQLNELKVQLEVRRAISPTKGNKRRLNNNNNKKKQNKTKERKEKKSYYCSDCIYMDENKTMKKTGNAGNKTVLTIITIALMLLWLILTIIIITEARGHGYRGNRSNNNNKNTNDNIKNRSK